ncbi:unnamed protein product [Dovyalis caffra]|uniref:Leucine-rich repeat-containing N-terminal plant-type domain-containing protein n=1 Tax=Dovyalis caffra TaxID=77055 RepID=A0AAV1RPE7_9ROSI|nr:unnamed protein product [Dovyalis caffra]
MEIKRWSLVTVVVGMVNVMLLVEGCLEEERIAILQIKTSFYYPNATSSLHDSWRKYANCCNWKGVSCNATTGRVVDINLSFERLAELGDGYLNATLFFPFQELISLSLHGNNILGCVENEGFERLSQLGSLKRLDLGDNKFNNSILTSLSALSSLKSLNLANNRLKGSINIEELNRLRSLEELYLAHNEIEGFKSFHGGNALLKLSNLKFLHLDGNHFNNNILPSLESLSSLNILNLSDNHLKGSFNIKGLDALINLETLSLDENEIDKFVISEDSRGFPNLRTLLMGRNHFDGTILAQGD